MLPLAHAVHIERVFYVGGAPRVIGESATLVASRSLPRSLVRIGGASALFAVGCNPEHIKAMGRWWSGAYKLYIRAVQGNAQTFMVQACSHKGEYLPDTPDDESPDDAE